MQGRNTFQINDFYFLSIGKQVNIISIFDPLYPLAENNVTINATFPTQDSQISFYDPTSYRGLIFAQTSSYLNFYNFSIKPNIIYADMNKQNIQVAVKFWRELVLYHSDGNGRITKFTVKNVQFYNQMKQKEALPTWLDFNYTNFTLSGVPPLRYTDQQICIYFTLYINKANIYNNNYNTGQDHTFSQQIMLKIVSSLIVSPRSSRLSLTSSRIAHH